MNKKKWAIVITLMLFFLCFLAGFLVLDAMLGDNIETAEHLDAVDWLPGSASNISYYRNKNISGLFSYEFTMAEPDFLEYAMERGWKLRKIDSPVFTRLRQDAPCGSTGRNGDRRPRRTP